MLVEWCIDESFDENCSPDIIVHSDIVKNCFLREYVIRDLTIGQKCYVRVSAGNLRGFGPPTIANPPYCVPSSKFFKFNHEFHRFYQKYSRLAGIFKNITSEYMGFTF